MWILTYRHRTSQELCKVCTFLCGVVMRWCSDIHKSSGLFQAEYMPGIMPVHCCVLMCLGIGYFIHIHQGYFTGTWGIIWLRQCQWSNLEGFDDKYYWCVLKLWSNLNQCTPNYVNWWYYQNKTKHNKTMCMHVYIYIYLMGCSLLLSLWIGTKSAC